MLASPLVAWAAPYLDRRVIDGTTLDGLSVSGAREGELYGAARVLADEWLDTPVTLLAGDVAVHATRRELGARIALTESVEGAQRRGRSGDPLRDIAARTASSNELALVRRFDTEAGIAALERIREQVDVPPLAPTTDASGRAVPGRGGRVMSSLGALERLERALLASEPVIELPVQQLAAPTVMPISPDAALYTHTLSSFRTRYSLSEEQWGREQNIVTAAAALDGAVIPAFESLSFNEVVGERTIERGYRPAEELSQGRIVEGIGGGICQVAATLHAAAFLGGLEILEHHPHTRTSRYIDLGLDAAVSWPSVDLRVRNPFPFPLRVRASTARGVLTIALLGAAAGPDVRWSATVEQVISRGRDVEPVEGGVSGTRELVDEGVDGLVVRRERVFRLGSRRMREVVRLSYPAVSRLERVAQ